MFITRNPVRSPAVRYLAPVAVSILAAVVAAQSGGSRRPRIGLVLSGGGARGAAHVGVLEVLEELRIPVDCISGTSMGAIVGGLYAYGYSPAELREILREINWPVVFRDRPERRDLPFRRKRDSDNFLVKFQLGYGEEGFRFPRGLVAGHNLGLLLRRLTIHAYEFEDFDRLPIPFRAVATDLDSGTAVVIGRGDLALAMRASMSLPGIFTPAEVDGLQLVDGGIADNLPVEVVQSMDADVVIAVDISTPLKVGDEIRSLLGVTDQMLKIMVRANTRAQREKIGASGVLITPDLDGIGPLDFAAHERAVQRGVEAASASREQLRRLGVSDAEYRAFLKKQRRTPAASPRVSGVEVYTDSGLSPSVLRARIDLDLNEPLDIDSLESDLADVFGLNTFQRVGYRLRGDRNGAALEVQADRKSWGPSYVRLGLEIRDDFDGRSTYNLAAEYTATELNALGGEWRTRLQIGDESGISTEWYQPLDEAGTFFFLPAIGFGQASVDTFRNGTPVARSLDRRVAMFADAGINLSKSLQLSLGAARLESRAHRVVGDPTVGDFDGDDGSVRAQLFWDSFDNLNFPSRGVIAVGSWVRSSQDLGATGDYEVAVARTDVAYTIGGFRLVTSAELSTTLSGQASLGPVFDNGGFFSLSGVSKPVRGEHFGLASQIVYRQIGGLAGGVLETPIYLGGSVEVGNAWADLSDVRLDRSLILAGSVFLGADTLLGPVFLGLGMAERGERSVYLFVGTPFSGG